MRKQAEFKSKTKATSKMTVEAANKRTAKRSDKTTTCKRAEKTSEAEEVKPAVKIVQKHLPIQLLSPEEFEAVTRATYYHPESQLILKLFLHVSHFWHTARYMQEKPVPCPKPINWEREEEIAARLIQDTLQQLLAGVSVTPWQAAIAKKRGNR